MSLADLRQLAVPSSQKRMTRSQMRVPNGMVEMTGKEYVHHKEVRHFSPSPSLVRA